MRHGRVYIAHWGCRVISRGQNQINLSLPWLRGYLLSSMFLAIRAWIAKHHFHFLLLVTDSTLSVFCKWTTSFAPSWGPVIERTRSRSHTMTWRLYFYSVPPFYLLAPSPFAFSGRIKKETATTTNKTKEKKKPIMNKQGEIIEADVYKTNDPEIVYDYNFLRQNHNWS